MKLGVVTATLLVLLVSWMAIVNDLNRISSPEPLLMAAATSTAQLFAQKCAQCHGKDGRAK